ncbi:uncharacterized protein LOC143297167 [Babylonia areolata]|uniref:uncharacterized protein LOC143297167 n=1 Tax=Babylonia areolata TaxID=304850 RepID=UPI003FD0C98D
MTPLCMFRASSVVGSIITLCVHLARWSTLALEAPWKDTEWPCTNRLAIEWVRHPDDCSQYFICHFGQPLAMPQCPFGQVWGIGARNCVPEQSRWNDCNFTMSRKDGMKNFLDSLVAGERLKKYKYNLVIVPSTPQPLLVSVQSIAEETVSSTKVSRPKSQDALSGKRTSPTTPAPPVVSTTAPAPDSRKPEPPKYEDGGHRAHSNSTQLPWKDHDLKKTTRDQTVTSPFHPSSRKKYYTYPRKTKTKVTKKPPTRPPHPEKPTKPTKPPTKTPVTTRHVATATPRKTNTFPKIPATKIPRTKIPVQHRQKTPRPTKTSKNQKVEPDSKKPEEPRKIHRTKTPLMFITPKPQRKHHQKTPLPRPPTLVPSQPEPRTAPPQSTQRTSANPQVLKTPPTKTTVTNQRRTPPSLQKRPTVSTPKPQHVRTLPPQLQEKTKTVPWQEKEEEEEEEKRFGLQTIAPPDFAVKSMFMTLPPGHPCESRPDRLVTHPAQCHWFYNCTAAALDRPAGDPRELEEECRYPQLFDTATGRCREFINVRCLDRFEPVDPCEYHAHNQCRSSHCVPCQNRFGACRGLRNGIYPLHTSRWTPTFVTCYMQRNIAQDDCEAPTPLFSPVARDCVPLSEVPKENGGLRPDCAFRQDGFYPDEQGRCGIFFQCHNGTFQRYDECPLGTVFDPLTVRCQRLQVSTPPCGDGPPPSCSLRPDGFHADPFGRCPYYFECRHSEFVQHHTCDFGSFDPVSQDCVIPAEGIPRPCGLLPNPCEGKPSGFHPDQSSRCRHYVECSRGILISRATCPEGLVFSVFSGKCERPKHVPQPCGTAVTCEGRGDGRYPWPAGGCGFYFRCRGGRLEDVGRCGVGEGGVLFNERTGKCDFPHNVCPPCGYRWWGCARSLHRPVSRDHKLPLNISST